MATPQARAANLPQPRHRRTSRTSPPTITRKNTQPGNQTGSWYQNMKYAHGWTTCVLEWACAYRFSQYRMYGAIGLTCGATVNCMARESVGRSVAKKVSR